MSRHPITAAFECRAHEPSLVFRDALLVRLQSELSEPAAARASGTIVEAGHGNSDHSLLLDDTPEVAVVAVKRSHWSHGAFVRIAAAIVAAAGIGVVATYRNPQRTGIDTSRDRAIAESALLTPDMVDRRWDGIVHKFEAYTSRVAADLATNAPECAPYVDYAFDSPRRDAATAGRVLSDENNRYLFQWVYVFPTADAASRAMDKISEPAFASCMNRVAELSYPILRPGQTSTMTTVETSPLAPHGDRQVAFGTYATNDLDTFADDSPGFSIQTVNVFVQVGRGIVYVNPTPDFHSNSDPGSDVDIAVVAAVNALVDALGSHASG